MIESFDDTDITSMTNMFINNMYKNGFWQILMFILIEVSIMYTGVFVAFSGTFTAAHMNYMCRIPLNHTSLYPSMNQCNVWNIALNRTEECTTGYKFYPDQSFIKSSIKADFQLICDRSYLDGVSQSCVMAGFFIGGILGPLLADEIGRRYVLFISLFIAGSIGILMAFIKNVYLFIAGSLIMGIMREVSMSTGFVYGLEFIPNYKQSLFGFLTQLMWSVNITILGFLAYFIREWRYLQIIGSLPILLSGFLLFIVPESPRWLIVKGKFENLQITVEKFANKVNKRNTKPSDYITLQNLYRKNSCEQSNPQKTTTQYSPLDILKSKILFFWTVILIFNWMFIVLSYYGSTMLLINLPGNKYFAFILTSSMELPFTISAYLMIQVGKNLTFLLYSLLCSLPFIIVGFINIESTTAIFILSIIGKGSLAGLFYMIVVTSVYIYPTTIRSFGTGLPSALGKLFAVIVPYFVKLHDIYRWLPTLIIGVSACFIGLLNMLFPDWINRPLPETIKDLDPLKKEIGIRFKKRVTTVKVR